MNFKLLIISTVIFLAVDYVYLSLMKDYFNTLIKKIQGKNIKFNLLGAIICYIFLILALNYFILNEKKTPLHAVILGLCIYGVYESTNLAIFEKWDFETLIIDTLWGGVLFGIVTFLTQYIDKKLK
tara:strand:+ start:620 stop:997 length:378 start_codon:yes stop_codon:yes gene_type:complete